MELDVHPLPSSRPPQIPFPPLDQRSTFRDLRIRDPHALSSHISSHLLARQSGTVRHGQRLKPLVVGL